MLLNLPLFNAPSKKIESASPCQDYEVAHLVVQFGYDLRVQVENSWAMIFDHNKYLMYPPDMYVDHSFLIFALKWMKL